MVLVETLFHRGQALGKICHDPHAGEVTFKPKQGHARLAGRKWRSVTACKKAVIHSYRGKSK